MTARNLIEISHVSASYDGVDALDDVSINIKDGDFIGVIGPNGGGKTTLLKLILGLKKPDKGSINISEGLNIGYLPQQSEIDRMFPITVREVIYSGLMKFTDKSEKYLIDKYRDRYDELTQKMNIDSIADKTPGQISGGQFQKTLLCRSLISKPDLLLLDEPNTYIDKESEFELFQYLSKDSDVKAIMLVSHDIGTISQYVKTFACVNKGLYYHESNVITEKLLSQYKCPIQIIAHGDVPHTVLKHHNNV